MLSLFIAFIAFVVTVPIKVMIMGIEITRKTKEKIINKDKQTVFDKITKKKDNVVNSVKNKKAIDLLLRSLKLLALSLKFLLNLLRTVVVLFTTLGVFTIFLFAIVLILVVSTAAFVSMEFGNINIDESRETSNLESSYETGSVLGTLSDSNYNQIFGDNSTWLSCCESMFNWYYANIQTYQKSYAGTKGTGVREWYTCDLFSNPGIVVGDDCSAYVYACLAYAGFVSDTTTKGSWGSSTFADPTNSTLLKYFNPYHPDDYKTGKYKPRPGDIMAYSGHVEIIAQVEPGNCLSYSWGSVPRSNPCQRTGDINLYLHKMWSSNEHNVTVIWSLKDGVQTMNNISTNIIEGTDGGTASSGGKDYAGIYSGEDGYHSFTDSLGYSYDFTNGQWVSLMEYFFEDGKDGKTIDEASIEISSHTLEELCEILGIPYPYEEETVEETVEEPATDTS